MNSTEEILEQLGFSPQDATLYLSLLRAGESPVGALIDKTGTHRELVYGGLKRLEKQGLVQAVKKMKVRHYQAVDPSELVRKVQEKAILAQSILPDLQGMFKQVPLSVRVFEGADGFEEVQKDIATSLKDRDEYFVIGGAGDAWYSITEKFYRKYHRNLFKRGIKIKTVTSTSEARSIDKYELPGFSQIRVIPEGFSVPSSTMIYADKIVIQVFGEQPVAILVRSEAISESYKQYFQTLWNIAQEAI